MNKSENLGFRVRQYNGPVKRYCQTLDLKESPDLIARYIQCHSEPEAWPEIIEGIREVGILEMEIYLLGNRLFMIVETPVSFDWTTAMERLSRLPRQEEWEDLVSVFQNTEPGATSSQKWKLMERIFHLYPEKQNF